MMPQQPYENKYSSLLSKEESDQVFDSLGARSQSLATTVIQLFVTQGPYHSEWIKKYCGVLCFVKDHLRKSYFFRLYCLKKNSWIWEHELYNNIDYNTDCEYLHIFEGEDCIIGFNFANTDEANDLKVVVKNKILAKRRKKEARRNLRNSIDGGKPHLPTNNDIAFYKKPSDPAERKAKRKRNLTKADIGTPSEFRHVSHVGWDPNKGFDINCDDIEFKEFFKKAGVSKKQLQDEDTRDFIYDFINKHGGREAVQEEVQHINKSPPTSENSLCFPGPPVPPRGTPRSSHSRAAPPPPPNLAPPIRSPRNPVLPALNTVSVPSFDNIPPPPPPPLPPPVDMPTPLPTTASSIPENPMADARNALMESIRARTPLKPVEIEKKVPDDSRGDLMNEIRKGFQLKPATDREVKPVSPSIEENRGNLAGALARALAERSRVIHSEDDTSDTDSNDDDDWDA